MSTNVSSTDVKLTHFNSRQELPFKDWHVAFTVDLKLQDSGNNVKELVLDFSSM